jgi:hypothetical protein
LANAASFKSSHPTSPSMVFRETGGPNNSSSTFARWMSATWRKRSSFSINDGLPTMFVQEFGPGINKRQRRLSNTALNRRSPSVRTDHSIQVFCGKSAIGPSVTFPRMPFPSQDTSTSHDDPFIVGMNITRLQSLLRGELDEALRETVRRLLSEFGAMATRKPGPR